MLQRRRHVASPDGVLHGRLHPGAARALLRPSRLAVLELALPKPGRGHAAAKHSRCLVLQGRRRGGGRRSLLQAVRWNPLELRGYLNFLLTMRGVNGYSRANAIKDRLREALVG